MARPVTKDELIRSANSGYEKLIQLIDSMSHEELSTTFGFTGDEKLKGAHWRRDKNVRDVPVHLYEWHQLLLKWIKANMGGDPKPFLPEPYNWKTYGDMNVMFWQKHQGTPLEEARALLSQSHLDAMAVIETFSNEELFTNKHFDRMGTTSPGSYCVSATSAHYDWAMKKIKKHKADLKGKA
ncbi:ClbS/DfsB family four-helix bundle protein [Porphyromonas sp.]|uniref:ClbS/DfsB family four-helix bundle protein n=1 Tax=Porphyromonas sp. TaxID=1924944 RepID=UPI0026DD41F9|nr:ClbS/DfsB family four-helix bundle protein [Porphyromonas sp.]MDO4770728.1 ClbS/DfsB family four-helix bundle protein [Porphyromonas sp.]